MREKVVVSWSGGKDSCLALYEIQKNQGYEVAALLTTVTRDSDRISMHGVRRVLLERQVEAIGLPLEQILITRGATNKEYESKMKEVLSLYREKGIKTVVFGDLFLEDIKQYREHMLEPLGIRGLFPIWKRNTSDLIREFMDSGFEAVVTCVDPKALDSSFAGRTIDNEFIAQLPPGVDPCGENGEFHTFVYAGPLFKKEVKVRAGGVVLRDGFYFCDLRVNRIPPHGR